MEFLLLPLLPVLLLAAGWVVANVAEGIVSLVQHLRDLRRARIERELNQKQEELRQTILLLAQHLDGSAHEARKALLRESFLASGQVAPDK